MACKYFTSPPSPVMHTIAGSSLNIGLRLYMPVSTYDQHSTMYPTISFLLERASAKYFPSEGLALYAPDPLPCAAAVCCPANAILSTSPSTSILPSNFLHYSISDNSLGPLGLLTGSPVVCVPA